HLRDRPGDEHGKEAVVRGEREDDAAAADVDAQLGDWHTAPVGKVPAGGRWRGLVSRRPDGPRDERVPSVGPYNKPRMLRHGRATPRVAAADASNPLAVGDQILDDEALA